MEVRFRGPFRNSLKAFLPPLQLLFTLGVTSLAVFLDFFSLPLRDSFIRLELARTWVAKEGKGWVLAGNRWSWVQNRSSIHVC